MDSLRSKLAAIEDDVEAGRYRPGPWAQFLRAARRLPRAERLALAADVSRVSSMLHRRHTRWLMPVFPALAIEVAGTAAGGALLSLGLSFQSDFAALAAMLVWVTTFQPLLKVGTGLVLGVRYEYAYLAGIEPRFKMRYGTYLAAPRWARVVLHLAGCVGSPLGAWVVARIVRPVLPLTAALSMAAFWIMMAINTTAFVAALAGMRRLGPLRSETSSGGAAGLELREAFVSES